MADTGADRKKRTISEVDDKEYDKFLGLVENRRQM
jgi:hypothetical protein